jgi:hypothetical protein
VSYLEHRLELADENSQFQARRAKELIREGWIEVRAEPVQQKAAAPAAHKRTGFGVGYSVETHCECECPRLFFGEL